LRARDRLLDSALLTIALLGPLFHLAGFLSRGLTFLYSPYAKLGLTYSAMALSAAAAGVAVVRRKRLWVRLIAGVALVVNLGAIGYVGNLWWRDMRHALADAAMSPIGGGQVGIAVAPANDSASARTAARATEDAINSILRRHGLGSLVVVRRAYPVHSEEQAERVGDKLGASIVVWERDQGLDLGAGTQVPLGAGEHHLTVLGANVTPVELAPMNVMLLMSTRTSLLVPGGGSAGGQSASPLATEVLAPVSVGFACLALGRQELAAAQFENALRLDALPSEVRRSLHSYLGVALLFAQRPDLAVQEYELARSIAPDAYAWVGTANSRMAQREWGAAIQAFNEAVALDPYYAVPYCGLGVLYSRERRVSQAMSSYRQAIALEPDWGAPYALLGLAFELDANVEAARAAYGTCALQAGPNAGLRQAVTDRAEEILLHPPTAVPTATPVPTPSPSPIPTAGMYRVRQGDTLAAIASQLDVSMEDLIEVNKIENPNALSVGQLLIIPKRSRPTPRSTRADR